MWLKHNSFALQASCSHCAAGESGRYFRKPHLGMGERGGCCHGITGQPASVHSVHPSWFQPALQLSTFLLRILSSAWRCFWQPSPITSASRTSRTSRRPRRCLALTHSWPCGTSPTSEQTFLNKSAMSVGASWLLMCLLAVLLYTMNLLNMKYIYTTSQKFWSNTMFFLRLYNFLHWR